MNVSNCQEAPNGPTALMRDLSPAVPRGGACRYSSAIRPECPSRGRYHRHGLLDIPVIQATFSGFHEDRFSPNVQNIFTEGNHSNPLPSSSTETVPTHFARFRAVQRLWHTTTRLHHEPVPYRLNTAGTHCSKDAWSIIRAG